MIQKLHLRGPGAHCYFLKHHYVLLKERSWSPDGKRLYGFPLCIEHHEMLFFKRVGVLILQRLCHYMKGGESMRAPLKDRPSHLDFLSTVTLLIVISPFLSVFVGPHFSFPVFILHGSFQLTHFVSVIRQIRRSKITRSVVSHSFRSTGLFSKIALLDCSAWGIIDQYQVCSLFYIWLVNFTHSVLISYPAFVHMIGLMILCTYILNCSETGNRRMSGLSFGHLSH